jgi:hypothetical protein
MITSPGTALLMAVCRASKEETVMVAAGTVLKTDNSNKNDSVFFKTYRNCLEK